MSLLFIADLHLDASEPIITEQFKKFMSEIVPTAQALYILGDFFETWIGDDDLNPFNLDIMQVLKQAALRTKIYVMHGNRDFLLGKRFAKLSGCLLLPDEVRLADDQHTVLLMHGDSLCIDDLSYMAFRRKSRLWLVQKLFLWKSLANRRAIATTYREKSRLHTSRAEAQIMDVNDDAVEKKMLAHSADILIHGHTHRPAKHSLHYSDRKAFRYVLGAWHDGANYLRYQNGIFDYICI